MNEAEVKNKIIKSEQENSTVKSEVSSSHGNSDQHKRSHHSVNGISKKESNKKRSHQITEGHLQDVLVLRPYETHSFKSIPSRILFEEDYVDLLETIIQRIFFPDLQKLRLQRALLDVQLGKSTVTSVSQIQKQLESIEKNPSLSFAPKRVKLQDGREIQIDVAGLSLQEFQSLFTSEDNASFERIIHDEKKKLALDQMWIEEGALTHNERNASLCLAVERGEAPAQLITAPADARNAFMFPSSAEMGRMSIHRVATFIKGKKDDKQSSIVAMCLGKQNLSAESSSSRDSGTICVENTRLPSFFQVNELSHKAALEKQINFEEETLQTSLFDEMVQRGVYSAVELMKEKKKQKLNGPQNHRNNATGVSLLDEAKKMAFAQKQQSLFLSTPVFKAGENMTPIMTWGKIAATPLIYPNKDNATATAAATDDVSGRFSIPEPSPKDLAAMKLADHAAKRLLDQKAKQSLCLRNILTPTSSLAAKDNVFGTPARHSLLRLKSNSKTPNLIVTHQHSIKKKNTVMSCPKQTPEHMATTIKPTPQNITDNLLNF